MEEQNFKTNARIVFEIGKESIENKTIALSEIIKNSYDAGATKCDVVVKKDGEMVNLLDKKISSLEIIDDGVGMDKSDLINNWLIIGTNNKKNAKNDSVNVNKNRIPVGEKGIGRFAINKIGNDITIITKKKNNLMYYMHVDFNDFMDNKMLEDVKIYLDIYNGNDGIKTDSGTKIIINNLNENWDDSDLENVYSEILKLQSPFKNERDRFDINFICDDKDLFDDMLTIDQVLKYSLWQCSIKVIPGQESGNMKFSFTPYLEMKLDDSEINEKIVYNDTGKKLTKIDISKYKIGPLNIKLYAFHRTPKVLGMLHMKKDALTKYLDENGGVRVYRSGQRIYNYGSKDEDWLGLNLKRLNAPSKNLSKNIIIGIVDLDSRLSGDLIEKTNREGFIDNYAFEEFKKMVEVVVDNFAYLLSPSKQKVKELIDKNTKRDRIDDTVDELIEEIKNTEFVHDDEKNDVIKKMYNIATEFRNSRKLYLAIASNSVEFNMIFHDIDKQVKNLLNIIRDDNYSFTDLKNSVVNINDLLNAQSDLIKNRDFSKINSNTLFKKFENYAYYRLKDHNISLEKQIEDFNFIGIESQLLRIFINLFDNSVYWLELQNKKNVFIKIIKEKNNVVIYFADNGPGFNVDDPNILFQPFVSKKKNGLGLGLFIVNEIVSMHNGKISFDFNDALIPQKYCGVKYKIELEYKDEIK